MELPIQKHVEAKTLMVYAKVGSTLNVHLIGSDKQVIAEQEDGPVPAFMPGEHYGEYVIFDIDIDTGQIINWRKPTVRQVMDWIDQQEAKRVQ